VKPKNRLRNVCEEKTELKLNETQNNPEGKFKSQRETGVAQSCHEAWSDRAKYLEKSAKSTKRHRCATWHGRATWLAGRA